MRTILALLFVCLNGTHLAKAQVSQYVELGNDPNEVSDTRVLSRLPTNNYGTIIVNQALEGTYRGVAQTSRAFFRYDDLFTKVPKGAIIDSARLEFYVIMPSFWPHATDNSFYLSRVLSPWDEMTMNHLNQPSVETSDEIVNGTIYPPYYEGWESLDVANHLQYFVDNPNEHHGWRMRLVTEVRHRLVQFYSSDYNNGSHTPKLKVWYRIPLHYELSNVRDGSIYYTNGNQLFFKHMENYKEGSLSYKVYEDQTHIEVTSNATLELVDKDLSFNTYRLDCTSLADGHYYLEVTTEKNQKLTLRFHNKL